MVEHGPRIAVGGTADIYLWDEDRVLKLFHADRPEDVIAYEADLTARAHAAGLPAPAVFERVRLGGRSGIVYERIVGPPLAQLALTQPWNVSIYAKEMAELHLRLHSVDSPDLPDYRDRVARKIRAVEPLPQPAKDAALKALADLPEGRSACHGDFHPGNILMAKTGPIVIDWMDAGRGAVAADVARTLLLLEQAPWHAPNSLARLTLRLMTTAFSRAYLRAYLQRSDLLPADIDTWRAPLAAARLAERIAVELRSLLAIVRDAYPFEEAGSANSLDQGG